jgi:hypothetical protein
MLRLTAAFNIITEYATSNYIKLYNQEYIQNNSAVHSVNTSIKHHFTDLSCFQKSATLTSKFLAIYHLVTKFLWMKKSQFKVALTIYLNTHSFYTVDKFLLSKNDSHSTQRFV